MNINITGKDFEITDAIKDTINEKVARLSKYLGEEFDATATLKIEGNQQVAEIRITVGGSLYKAVAASKDLYSSIDKDIEIIEGQIRKNKTKNDKQNMTDSIRFKEAQNSSDVEMESEIIKTFYYITSEQYIYEHLFENDSFNGMQNLLKHVNLANKKASYDYSYLDMTKNASVSKENETIINTLKVINEYINNRTYLERKLIKNFPIENVPNIVPNYFSFGIKINIVLNDYKISRRLVKIGNHEETKDLINKYKEEFSHHENKNTKQTLHDKKLFNIQENLEENESGKSDVNSETNVKKENSKWLILPFKTRRSSALRLARLLKERKMVV